ncbi:MAG: type II secretion system GspH family protein [Anaerohalosphaeraceae bacterium]|nr:type II secretion system GspH family protein [Anaerohalosphaeraceae bacterium]
MKKQSGFTLVEILIVVVILGILAAIVVPQFSDASAEAKTSSLVSDLQTMRSQIQLYKIQHSGALPGANAGTTFTEAMTGYTTVLGAVGDVNDYGPYMQKIPTNQFTDLATITENGTLGDASAGWEFNTSTGAFHADDTVAHSAL